MGRYRRPEKSGSNYITPAGAARLRAELERLWRRERPAVTAAVTAAAAQGDRSENADYTYGKRRLREIDRRVRYLRQRLEGMTIVDRPPADPGRVYFGARVGLEDDAGRRSDYRLVGPDELDVSPEHISIDAPLARALLGRRLEDCVELALSQGARRFRIVAIDYPAPALSSHARS